MSAALDPRPRFRRMQVQDLVWVMQIEPEIYTHPWTLVNFQDALLAGYSCWVMDCAGCPCGYGVLMLGVGEAHLLNISVAGASQRRGLGRALIEHLRGVAQGYGAERMLLEVRPSNAAARALYDSTGFMPIGLRPGYYPACGGREDALVLEWAL